MFEFIFNFFVYIFLLRYIRLLFLFFHVLVGSPFSSDTLYGFIQYYRGTKRLLIFIKLENVLNYILSVFLDFLWKIFLSINKSISSLLFILVASFIFFFFLGGAFSHFICFLLDFFFE
jgi:hypothetical protein